MTKNSFDEAFKASDVGVAAAAPMIALRRQLIEADFPADIASEMARDVLVASTEQLRLQTAHAEAYAATVHAAINGVDISHIQEEK